MKAHQGTLQVRPAPAGEGAEFLVSLPGLREERPPDAPKPPVDEEERQRARERRRKSAEARLRRRRKRRRKQQA